MPMLLSDALHGPNGAVGRVPCPRSPEVPVSSSALSLVHKDFSGLNLIESAIAKPALSSHVRPALVLPERETRELLSEATRLDVGNGGCFSAGPAGIQVWT